MDFIPEERNTGYFQYEPYMDEIARCRSIYGDKLVILAAIEIDYCPDLEREIANWLDGKQFDFIVGSVHYLRGLGNISEPRAAEFFAGKTAEEAYGVYFDAVLKSARFGIWDALGHIDLVKRYGVRPYGAFDDRPFERVLDEIFATVISKGMALEINTSGLRQAPRQTYPEESLLRRYCSLGGARVTIGSDSHTAAHVGAGVAQGIDLLLDANLKSILAFRKRRGSSVPIDSLREAPGPETCAKTVNTPS
jgi:histidinol-phosphatase (PHP family)